MRIKQKWFVVLIAISTFLLTVYIESLSNGEILFLNEILKEDVQESILNAKYFIVPGVGIINLILYLRVTAGVESKASEAIYNNICRLVFDKFIDPDKNLENAKFRVSLFKAKKRVIFRRSLYFLPQYQRVLINVGRYETNQDSKRCSIKFLSGEGAVGMSYSASTYLHESTTKFTTSDKEKYYEDQLKGLNLPKFKAKKLKIKPSDLICCPISKFRSTVLFGVLVIDSVEPGTLGTVSKNEFKQIKQLIRNFSVLFNHTS